MAALLSKLIGEQYRLVSAQREIRRTLARIEASGARALYRAVDIRDAAAVGVRTDNRYVSKLRRPVRGIIHGAGVLADARIEDKTVEQFERVYATKVAGLRALLQAVDPDELRALVLFSSSTGRFGRAGQVDYAIANEVLNKLAQQQARRLPRCRVVSVNWGPWDGGMVSARPQESLRAGRHRPDSAGRGCELSRRGTAFARREAPSRWSFSLPSAAADR